MARVAEPGDDPHLRVRPAMREARIEAVVVLALDVALLAGLAALDKANGWGIIELPWWLWLLLAAPALIFMVLLLAAPLAEMSPGRMRNARLRAARAPGPVGRGGRRAAPRRAREQ